MRTACGARRSAYPTRSGGAAACCGLLVALLLTAPAAAQTLAAAPPVVAQIRVHGNTITPEADVLAIAALTIGAPYERRMLNDVKTRLEKSGRFDDIEVLQRYASIEDLSKIQIVILIHERPGRIVAPTAAGEPARVVFRRGIHNLMLMPMLDAEDGYGVTYGVRLALVRLAGRDGRVTMPLSWGGTKQAGATFERSFASGALTRLQAGVEVAQRRNPFYATDDRRTRIWTRVERRLGPLRIGEAAAWERVAFGDAAASDGGAASPARVFSTTGDATIDTRVDPVLARNAVFLRVAASRLRFDVGDARTTTSVDARAYLGLVRQLVLVGRVTHEASNGPLPLFLKPLLGGWSTLRGFEAGAFAGDNRATASLELRAPFSRTLSVAHAGVSLFVDAGATYDDGQRLGDQPLHRGIGGSFWVSATAFRAAVSVARGVGATRVNFAVGAGF